jgi:hypothetical protein
MLNVLLLRSLALFCCEYDSGRLVSACSIFEVSGCYPDHQELVHLSLISGTHKPVRVTAKRSGSVVPYLLARTLECDLSSLSCKY